MGVKPIFNVAFSKMLLMATIRKNYDPSAGGTNRRSLQAVTAPRCFALIRSAISRLLCFSNTISDGVSILGAFEVASF